MLSINTNVASLLAQNSLASTQADLTTSVQALSSGLRVSSAASDAASLAISQSLQAQLNGINPAIQDLNDATNVAQTADSGLANIQDLLLSMKQLATQGFDGSLSASQRTDIVQQLGDLNAQVNNTAQSTQYNGISLLTSSVTTVTSNSSGASENTPASATISGLIGANSAITLDSGNGFVLTVGSHQYSTNGTVDGVVNNLVPALSASGYGGAVSTVSDLDNWINNLSSTFNLGVTSTISSDGASLSIAGGIDTISTAGIFSNAIVSGFNSSAEAINLTSTPFSLAINGVTYSNSSATNLTSLNNWINGLGGVQSQVVGNGSNYSLLINGSSATQVLNASPVTLGGGGSTLNSNSDPAVATATISNSAAAGNYTISIPSNQVTISGFQTLMDEMNNYPQVSIGGVTYSADPSSPNYYDPGGQYAEATADPTTPDNISGLYDTQPMDSNISSVYDLKNWLHAIPGISNVQVADNQYSFYGPSSSIQLVDSNGNNNPSVLPFQDSQNSTAGYANTPVNTEPLFTFDDILFDPTNPNISDPTGITFTLQQDPSSPEDITLTASNGDSQTINLSASINSLGPGDAWSVTNQLPFGINFDQLGVNIFLNLNANLVDTSPGAGVDYYYVDSNTLGGDPAALLAQALQGGGSGNTFAFSSSGAGPTITFDSAAPISLDNGTGLATSDVGSGSSEDLSLTQSYVDTYHGNIPVTINGPNGTVTTDSAISGTSFQTVTANLAGTGLTQIDPLSAGSTTLVVGSGSGGMTSASSVLITNSSLSASTGAPVTQTIVNKSSPALDFQSGATSNFHVTVNTTNVLTSSNGVASQMTSIGNNLSQDGSGNLAGLTSQDSEQSWQTAFENLSANLDNAINFISSQRSYYGSVMNTIGYNVQNLQSQAVNTQNSNSALVDANYAQEMSNLTKDQIKMQAGTAVLAQANQAPSTVLNLLSKSFSKNYDIQNFVY
jgi:flagellin